MIFKTILVFILSYLSSFRFIPSIIKDISKESIEIGYKTKWWTFGILSFVFFIALIFIDLDYKRTLTENVPFKFFSKKDKPLVSCSINERDVSKYSNGELINGILWNQAYEKYELIIENKSGYPLYDFNCIFTIPGFILQKDIIESKSDNPSQILIKNYDYELEMLEQQKDGRFVHSENVVPNRFDIYI